MRRRFYISPFDSRYVKSKTAYITLSSEKDIRIVRITSNVQRVVAESGITEGLALIAPMHMGSGVMLYDSEDPVVEDPVALIKRLESNPDPQQGSEDREAAVQLMRQLMGHQVVVAVTEGRLDLSPSEKIIYLEFEHQRQKRVLVKIIGE